MSNPRVRFTGHGYGKAPPGAGHGALTVEEQPSLLFDHNPMPTWIVDHETLAYLAVNNAAINTYGYSRDEFLSMTAKDIRPREDAPKFARYIRSLPESGANAQIWRHVRKNGEQLLVEMIWHETEFHGRPALLVFGKDVTEQQRMERSLFQHEQEFRALVENSPDIISRINRELRYLYVNSAVLRITGLQPSALIGATPREARVLPEDVLDVWEEKARETFATGKETQHAFTIPVQGETRHFSMRILPEFGKDGTVVTVLNITYDITDEKKTELAMRESQERLAHFIETVRDSELRFRSIFRSVPVALLELDPDGTRDILEELKNQGVDDLRTYLLADRTAADRLLDHLRITEANDAALRMFGAHDKAELSESVQKLCEESTQAALLAGLVTFSEGDTHYAGETVVRTLRGKRVHALFAMTVAGDMLWGHKVLLTLVDVTQRKQSEAERGELLAREHTARRQAEMASRAKDEFLATLSHELRTPLNAILGWTQTLQQGALRRDLMTRGLAAIERSARTQAELVDDLLYVADIVAGRLRLNIQSMRLMPTIQAAAASLRPAMDAKGIEFETSLSPDADEIIGDAMRLQQVVWNLLSNAVKFTPAGGHIGVSLVREGSHVEISVVDDGEGIKPGFLPYVFERFRQADGSSRKRHGGLGIGLAIVRHLVELHGGTVLAHSAGEGRGATFTVKLPMRPSSDPSLRGESEAEGPRSRERGESRRRPGGDGPGAGKPLEGLRVLFVDDDPFTREMLEEAFKGAGALPCSAASAREALEKTREWRPDVIVSDIGMPEEDGFDFMLKVRDLPADGGGATPSVALTGYARERDRQAVMNAGYQAFTPKPVDLDELFRIILQVTSATAPH